MAGKMKFILALLLVTLWSGSWGSTAWAQDAPQINSGDTAWILVSSALVMAMTLPGLALFYGGLVRTKNVLATIGQSAAILCVVTLVWILWGYTRFWP